MTLSLGLYAGGAGGGILQPGDELTSMKAVDYDGTNDYSSRATDLVGNVNGTLGILSAWFRLDGGDGANRFLYRSHTALADSLTMKFDSAANKLVMLFPITGGFNIVSTTAFTASASWRHLLVSWDAGTPANSKGYLDDASETLVITGTPSGDIEYTNSDHAICAALISGTALFNGCLTDLYINLGEFLALDTEANRRKFISAAGKPVFLDVDGSGPTGTAPIIYYRDGIPFNLGTGGGFDVSGALEACSDTPLG